jgi:ABC-type transport system substrate-binding protein
LLVTSADAWLANEIKSDFAEIGVNVTVEVAQISDYIAKRDAGLFELIIVSTTVT